MLANELFTGFRFLIPCLSPPHGMRSTRKGEGQFRDKERNWRRMLRYIRGAVPSQELRTCHTLCPPVPGPHSTLCFSYAMDMNGRLELWRQSAAVEPGAVDWESMCGTTLLRGMASRKLDTGTCVFVRTCNQRALLSCFCFVLNPMNGSRGIAYQWIERTMPKEI